MRVKVNINNKVYVDLTEEGVQHLRLWHERLYAGVADEKKRAQWIEDAMKHGSTGPFQLWQLMMYFGDEMHMGGRGPNFFVQKTEWWMDADEVRS